MTEIAVVLRDNLNVHRDVGMLGEWIGVAMKGDRLPVIGRKNLQLYTWLQVRYRDETGWIAGVPLRKRKNTPMNVRLEEEPDEPPAPTPLPEVNDTPILGRAEPSDPTTAGTSKSAGFLGIVAAGIVLLLAAIALFLRHS